MNRINEPTTNPCEFVQQLMNFDMTGVVIVVLDSNGKFTSHKVNMTASDLEISAFLVQQYAKGDVTDYVEQ